MNLKTLTRITLPLLAVLLCSGPLGAADWPRFLGPNASGVSPETGLARAWPTNGPRVLWSADVGEGFASPAVVDGQVFLLDRRQNKEDLLRCFDLETGRELWTFAYDAPGSLSYNGSRNVPTLDANRIFTIGPFGHFHCIDRASHQVLWAKHLVNDFKDPQIDRDTPPKDRQDKLARAQVPMWGVAQAPLVYRDTVIVAPQTQTTGLVAYDKATGQIRWRSGYIGRNWYSHISPTLMNLCGVDQVIMLAQPSDPEKAPENAPPATITSIDPNTGRILWTTKTPGPHKIPVPQPLRVAPDRIFITGGYKLGSVMLQVTHAPGRLGTENSLAQNRGCRPHPFPGSLSRPHLPHQFQRARCEKQRVGVPEPGWRCRVANWARGAI